jgi:hypothetical protein
LKFSGLGLLLLYYHYKLFKMEPLNHQRLQ